MKCSYSHTSSPTCSCPTFSSSHLQPLLLTRDRSKDVFSLPFHSTHAAPETVLRERSIRTRLLPADEEYRRSSQLLYDARDVLLALGSAERTFDALRFFKNGRSNYCLLLTSCPSSSSSSSSSNSRGGKPANFITLHFLYILLDRAQPSLLRSPEFAAILVQEETVARRDKEMERADLVMKESRAKNRTGLIRCHQNHHHLLSTSDSDLTVERQRSLRIAELEVELSALRRRDADRMREERERVRNLQPNQRSTVICSSSVSLEHEFDQLSSYSHNSYSYSSSQQSQTLSQQRRSPIADFNSSLLDSSQQRRDFKVRGTKTAGIDIIMHATDRKENEAGGAAGLRASNEALMKLLAPFLAQPSISKAPLSPLSTPALPIIPAQTVANTAWCLQLSPIVCLGSDSDSETAANSDSLFRPVVQAVGVGRPRPVKFKGRRLQFESVSEEQKVMQKMDWLKTMSSAIASGPMQVSVHISSRAQRLARCGLLMNSRVRRISMNQRKRIALGLLPYDQLSTVTFGPSRSGNRKRIIVEATEIQRKKRKADSARSNSSLLSFSFLQQLAKGKANENEKRMKDRECIDVEKLLHACCYDPHSTDHRPATQMVIPLLSSTAAGEEFKVRGNEKEDWAGIEQIWREKYILFPLDVQMSVGWPRSFFPSQFFSTSHLAANAFLRPDLRSLLLFCTQLGLVLALLEYNYRDYWSWRTDVRTEKRILEQEDICRRDGYARFEAFAMYEAILRNFEASASELIRLCK